MHLTKFRTAVVIALVLAGAVLAVAYSAVNRSDPSKAAEAFAKALSSGRLANISFANQSGSEAQKSWDAAVAGMDGSGVKVTANEAKETDGGTASAILQYDWDLGEGAKRWSYETKVKLKRSADKWLVRLEPTTIEPSLGAGERLNLGRQQAKRGDVTGAKGARLVTDRPVLRFGIDKTKVDESEQARSSGELARLVGIKSSTYVDRVDAAGEKAFVEAVVLRTQNLDPAIAGGYEGIPGAIAIPDELPLAPTAEFARPILGTVGAVTAEMIKASDGTYEAGDEAGLSGLQQRYDNTLGGTSGAVIEAVNVETGVRRSLFREEPRQGSTLKTTLDVDLQKLADDVLSDIPSASAIVAIRPSDGNILAAASGPGSKGYSTATVGTYAPGSTFKVVTGLAMLRAGMTPKTVLPCTTTNVVEGRRFENYDDYPVGKMGDITLRTAMANSCNTAFISARDRISQPSMAQAAASLGMGTDHDLGFPAYFGAVPSSATSTGHAAAIIGQGQVLASPMAMAAVVASIAQGETVIPRLLLDNKSVVTAPKVPLRSKEAAQLREMMRAVVTEGSGSFLAGLPGDPVLAKTGTAEFGDQLPLQTHAWMVAIHGDLAVAVFLEKGKSGSGSAGPLLKEFLQGAH